LKESKNFETENRAAAGTDQLRPLLSPSEQKEMQEIESLLLSNRRLSPEEEYLNLMVEIIYLEDRMDQFPSLAEAVRQYHQEAIQKNDFPKAFLLLKSLHDIKDVFAKNNKSKADLIEDMIKEMGQETALARLQESLQAGPVTDPDALFSYLKLIGPKAAGAVADLFEKSKDPGFRGKALDLLKQVGRIDVESLLRLTQESKPGLTKEIIASIGQSKDKRIIPYLANFLSYKNKAIKLEAIRALGKLENEAAAKILLGFISDGDEEVRTAAAENLKFCEDRQTLEQIFALVSEKVFNKRSAQEKKSFFDLLGRTRTAESCAFLRNTLTKPFVILDSKKKSACLDAVRALELMATPSAIEALKECARRRRGKIRKASLEALAKIAECAGPSSPQGTPK
jgi:HEAT repeat protein